MTEKKPEVSVIIVNLNGIIHLKECFDSLREQTYRDFEVIMVDNNSEDDSIEFTKANYPEVKIIKEGKNHGFCGGSNIGANTASGIYILLLNNDTVLQKDCLASLVDALKSGDERVFGVFPKVKFYYNRRIINAFGVHWHKRVHWRDFRVGMFDIGQYCDVKPAFGSIFPAVLLKKDIFKDMGMFDPAFFSTCEDFDLCYRANILGYKFFVNHRAEVFHKYRATTYQLFRPHWQHYFFVRNYMLVFLKNYEAKSLLKHFPYAFYRYILKGLIIAIKSLDLKFVYIYLRVILYLILKSPAWMKRRMEIQAKRVVPDEKVWTDTIVEEFNPFNYKGRFVYSLLNLRASLDENIFYDVNGKTYTLE